MLYLIDANSLIIVDRTYYSHYIVPEFWSWLEFQARKNVCKIPPRIFDEITPRDEKFKKWVNKNKNDLLLVQDARDETINHVLKKGYGENLKEVELNDIGNDHFLIASAMIDTENRCVVTCRFSCLKGKPGSPV